MTHELIPEGWQLVKLSTVLKKISDSETVEDDTLYQLIGVRLHGKGLRKQDEALLGKNISTKTLYRVRNNRLIYNKMWASKGTFALVDDCHDGLYATSEYPQFAPKADLIDLRYLHWVVLQPKFWQQSDVMSRGTTDRARLNPSDFLAMSIPLPPIDEQRRIAEVLRDADANVTHVDAQIEAAKESLHGALQLYFKDIKQTDTTRVNRVLKRIRREVDVDPNATYREIGIRSHGRGIFHKEPVTGKELGNKSVYWVEPGDFVLNIVFAWEGAVALVSEAERGMCGSHRFPTYEVNHKRIYPDYFLYYFKSFEGVTQLLSVSPGGAGRNKTLNQSDFMKLKIPLPDMITQCEIASTLQAHDNIIVALLRERDRLIEIKRGLMQKLLSGEVRV